MPVFYSDPLKPSTKKRVLSLRVGTVIATVGGSLFLVGAGVLLTLATACSNYERPYIGAVQPSTFLPGELVQVFGEGFGEKGEVKLDGKRVDIQRWSTTIIEFIAREGTNSGAVTLQVESPQGSVSTPVTIFPYPREVKAAPSFSSMGLAVGQACGIASDRSLFCWGSLEQAGAAPTVEQVPGSYVAVAAGMEHVCSVTTEHFLVCWGSNKVGEISKDLPRTWLGRTRVGSENWERIFAGGHLTCGIRQGSKSLECWGLTSLFSLSTTTITMVLDPNGAWEEVAVGGYHSCGIDGDGLFCWGNNFDGQLGQPVTIETAPIPVKVPGVWRHVSTGANHTCAIDSGRSLWCWGNNEYSQVSGGLVEHVFGAVRVGDAKWAAISAGANNTCAITEDGDLFCWGLLSHIGEESKDTIANQPRKMSSRRGWSNVFAAFNIVSPSNCATTDDMRVYCWGDDTWGQAGF